MVQAKWIDEEKLQKALRFQQQQGCLIGEALIKLHYATEEQVAMALGKQLGLMLTGLYGEFFRFPAFEHRLEPCLATAAVVLGRRGLVLGDAETAALRELFAASAAERAATVGGAGPVA